MKNISKCDFGYYCYAHNTYNPVVHYFVKYFYLAKIIHSAIDVPMLVHRMWIFMRTVLMGISTEWELSQVMIY